MKSNKREKLLAILPSIISVLAGLIFGWYLMFLTKPSDALGGLGTILFGGILDGAPGIGTWLYTATPIILTGLSVGCSIKTGLFNIGASGQFTVGGFTAILVACKVTGLPPVLVSVLAVFAGMAAGALWGAIAGAMKAYFSVNEVISGIMLNYTGMLLVNVLIKKLVYNPAFNRSADIPDAIKLGDSLIGRVIAGSRIGIAFTITIITVLIVKFMFDKTCFGYELKVTGKNRFAGIYAGINDKKSIILSMTICGALSGLAGTLVYLSSFGDHIMVLENILPFGFTGISVALLGMSDPIGIIIAGLFIAHIQVGGAYLQLYSYTPDVVDMIIGIIVFCGALVIPVRSLIEYSLKNREKMRGKAAAGISAEGKEAEA